MILFYISETLRYLQFKNVRFSYTRFKDLHLLITLSILKIHLCSYFKYFIVSYLKLQKHHALHYDIIDLMQKLFLFHKFCLFEVGILLRSSKTYQLLRPSEQEIVMSLMKI